MLLTVVFVILLPVVIFAVAYGQCFWSNFIKALNIILCSALAFNYAQPLANLINEQAPDWSAFTEFLCMWVLFIVLFLISNSVCNLVSRYPVRMGKQLDPILDIAGGAVLTAALYGWICFSLFAAPVGEEGFSQMMQSGFTNQVGQAYGRVAIGIPSQLGMGGKPFDITRWAEKRLQRAKDEANHG